MNWEVVFSRFVHGGWEDLDVGGCQGTTGQARCPIQQAGSISVTMPVGSELEQIEPGRTRAYGLRDGFRFWEGFVVSVNQQTRTIEIEDKLGSFMGLGAVFVPELSPFPSGPVQIKALAATEGAINRAPQLVGTRVNYLIPPQDYLPTPPWEPAEFEYATSLLDRWASEGLIYSAWAGDIWLADSISDIDGLSLSPEDFREPPNPTKVGPPWITSIAVTSGSLSESMALSSQDVNYSLPLIERVARFDYSPLTQAQLIAEAGRLLSSAQEAGWELGTIALWPDVESMFLAALPPGTIHDFELEGGPSLRLRIAEVTYQWQDGMDAGTTITPIARTADPYRLDRSSPEAFALSVNLQLSRRVQELEQRLREAESPQVG